MRPTEPIGHFTVKLPRLLEELSEKVRSYREIASKQGGPARLYAEGTAQALEEIAGQVHCLQGEALDAQGLLAALRAVQEAATRASQPAPANQFNLATLLRYLNLRAMNEAIVMMSKREGYRQAAGIIDWFLKDARLG